MIYYPVSLIDDNDSLYCLTVVFLGDKDIKREVEEYFISTKVKTIDYLSEFAYGYGGEYWIRDDLKCKTLPEAQQILLKILFRHQGKVI